MCVCITVPVFNYNAGSLFRLAALEKLSGVSVVSAMGLGFLLALLIFIDQNIVVSLTNAPENRSACSRKLYQSNRISPIGNVLSCCDVMLEFWVLL